MGLLIAILILIHGGHIHTYGGLDTVNAGVYVEVECGVEVKGDVGVYCHTN